MTKTIDALVEALELAMKYAAPAMALDKQSPSNAQWMVEAVMQQETFIKEALAQARAEQAEPVYQFRKHGCADWYDGHPDHTDGGGPYTTRTLYTTPPAAPVAKLEPLDAMLVIDGIVKSKCSLGGGEFPDVAFVKGVRFAEAAHNAKLGGAG